MSKPWRSQAWLLNELLQPRWPAMEAIAPPEHLQGCTPAVSPRPSKRLHVQPCYRVLAPAAFPIDFSRVFGRFCSPQGMEFVSTSVQRQQIAVLNKGNKPKATTISTLSRLWQARLQHGLPTFPAFALATLSLAAWPLARLAAARHIHLLLLPLAVDPNLRRTTPLVFQDH